MAGLDMIAINEMDLMHVQTIALATAGAIMELVNAIMDGQGTTAARSVQTILVRITAVAMVTVHLVNVSAIGVGQATTAATHRVILPASATATAIL